MYEFKLRDVKKLTIRSLTTEAVKQHVEGFPIGKVALSERYGYNATYFQRFLTSKGIELNVIPSLKLLKAVGYKIDIFRLEYSQFSEQPAGKYDTSTFYDEYFTFSEYVKKRDFSIDDLTLISGVGRSLVEYWYRDQIPKLFFSHLRALMHCGFIVRICRPPITWR